MGAETEYMSLEEVADMLGVTYQLIYRLVRSGELPAVRLGKLYRVSRVDLDGYLERSKGASASGRRVQRLRNVLPNAGFAQELLHREGLRRADML